MEKLLQATGRHPRASAIGVLLIILLCLPGLFRLESNPGFDGFFYASDKNEIEKFQQVVDQFSHESVALFVVESNTLLTHTTLDQLDELKDEIKSLPSVLRVRSLPDTPVTYEQRLTQFGKIREKIEADEIEHLLEISSGFSSQYLSDDHDATLLFIEIDPAQRSSETLLKLGEELAAVAERHQTDFSNIYQLGEPYYMLLQDRVRKQDGMRLIPIAIIGLIILVGVGLRSARATLFPIATGATSLIAAFGFMGWMEYPLTVFSFAIPVTLLLVGSTEDIFLLNEYCRQLIKQTSAKAAFDAMAKVMGRPVFATAASTIIGFLVVALSPVPIVREFGLTMAFGLTVNFIATVLIAPVGLRLIKPYPQSRSNNESSKTKSAIESLVTHLLNFRKAYLGLLITLSVLCLISLRGLKVENSFFEFYDDNSDMGSRIDHYTKRFSGPLFFNITLSPETGTFEIPQNLTQAEAIRRKLETRFPSTSISGLSQNLGNLLKMRSQVSNPNFPESPKTLKSYLSLLIRGDPSAFKRLSTTNLEQLRLIVQHDISNSTELQRLTNEMEAELLKIVPKSWEFSIVGQYNLISGGLDAATWNTLNSFPCVFIASAIVLAIILRSFRKGIIVLVPSTLAVLVIGFFSAYLDMGINIATGMIPVVTLALAVDHSIHLANTPSNSKGTIEDALTANRKPIIISFCGMLLCFGIISMSAFSPIASFGHLTVIGQVLSLLFALLALPYMVVPSKYEKYSEQT